MAADASIFSQYLKPPKSVAEYGAEMDSREANALELAAKRQATADDNAVRNAYQQSGGDPNKIRALLQQGGSYKALNAYDKAALESKKAQGEIDKNAAQTSHYGAQTSGLTQDQGIKARETAIRDIASYETPALALAGIDQYLAAGKLDQAGAQSLRQSMPQDPAQLPAWQLKVLRGIMNAKDQVAQISPDANARLSAETQTENSKRTAASSKYSTDSAATNSRLSREQSATQHKDRMDVDKTKPAGGKTGPMSVTLQKELLESDDIVQSAGNVARMLESAKKINKDAYSGYFAKGRAVLASNMPGATPGADATIDIDNMMTGQALESLKVVFGGMPTEGERKILLDMQASADKTPKQREAIMDRGIAAAKRRAEYAGGKAKAIRDGSYLTQGAAPMAEPSAASNKAVNFGDLK